MHGEILQMWLTKLKIAVIEKNTDAISKLLEETPKLSDKKEIERAIYLLKEASSIVTNLKNNTKDTMAQIKKNIDFLRSTEVPKKSKFDIMS